MSAENPPVKAGDEVVALAVYGKCTDCIASVGQTLKVDSAAGLRGIYCTGSSHPPHMVLVSRWTLPEPAEPWVPTKGDRVRVEFEAIVGHGADTDRLYVQVAGSGRIYAWVRPEHLTLIEPATPPEPDKAPGQVWEDAQGRRILYDPTGYYDDDRPWMAMVVKIGNSWWMADHELARPIKLILDAPGGE